jgi:molybdopterin converting factor small subunit
MATVTLPLLLMDVTGGARRTEVEGSTLAEIEGALYRIFPGIQKRIHSDGKILPYVILTIDGAVAAQGMSSPVGPQSEVSILPSMGGG